MAVTVSVTASELVTGSAPVTASYACDGGAGWHDAEGLIIRSGKRSWSDSRGYAGVNGTVAPGMSLTATVQTRYFRGMQGDRRANGTTKSATLACGGSAVATRDGDWLAGLVFESRQRPTRLSQGTATGPLQSAWFYDSAANGVGMLADSRSYPDAGTAGNGPPLINRVDAYDARGRVVQSSTVVPALQALSGSTLAGTYTTSYAYDAADRETSRVVPAAGGLPAETFTTTYDSLGRPDTLSGAAGAGYVSATGYDDIGRLTSRVLGGPGVNAQVVRDVRYDTQGRVSHYVADTLVGGTKTRRQYEQIGYDEAANATRVTDAYSGTRNRCNTFDGLNRLTRSFTTEDDTCATVAPVQSATSAYDLTYAYDAAGNITGSTAVLGTAAKVTRGYTYGDAAHPQAVTSYTPGDGTGAVSMQVGAAGETLTRTKGTSVTTLAWDAQLRVAAMSTAVTAGGSTTTTASMFAYDADGARLVKRVGTQVTLTVAGMELVSTGGTVTGTRYVSLGGTLVALRTSGGAVFHAVNDAQGTIVMLIDSAGDGTPQRQRYLPFGELRGTSTLAQGNGRGFLGAPLDTGTGWDLQYLNARYYDPVTARFLNPDPLAQIGDPQGLNAYQYARNNPFTYSDPTGLRQACSTDGDCAGTNPNGQSATVAPTRSEKYAGAFQAPKPPAPASVRFLAGAGMAMAELVDSAQMLDPKTYLLRLVGVRPPSLAGSLGDWQQRNRYAEGAAYSGGLMGTRAASFLIPFGGAAAGSARAGGRLAIEAEAIMAGRAAAKTADEGVEGGLNLFKWGHPTSTRPTGWRDGDYMLHLPNQGTPKANWAQNSSRLRSEMRSGRPIYDSYVDSKGSLIPTTGFLNAERNLLINRGWAYDPGAQGWFAP